jgi:Outer membrane protein beta-barrel domain
MRTSVRKGTFAAARSLTVWVLSLTACTAADFGGVYVGGVIGYSNLGLQGERIPETFSASGGFNGGTVGGGVLVGIRPGSLLGGEISFTRFGSATKSIVGGEVAVSEDLNGVAAEALFYLPVPRVEVFLKAGVADLFGELHSPQQNSDTTSYNHLHISELDFATGVGVQFKLDQHRAEGWAVRAQYDRFIGHGNTELAALGLTYSF